MLRDAALVLMLLSAASPSSAQGISPSQQEDATIPVPRPKPEGLVQGKTAARSTQAGWPAAGNQWDDGVVATERQLCASELAGRDIQLEMLAPIGSEDGCGAAAPVEVSSVAGVSLAPPAVVTCRVAARLHDWIAEDVQPAARKRLKTKVKGIRTASSYVCRLRNNAKSGKLSEHGRANALDMSGFTFEKSDSVTVEDGWGGILRKIGLSREGGFLDDIRIGACEHFATVLGPGSDPYHGDHFHVDAIVRKNDYRICK